MAINARATCFAKAGIVLTRDLAGSFGGGGWDGRCVVCVCVVVVVVVVVVNKTE